MENKQKNLPPLKMSEADLLNKYTAYRQEGNITGQ